MNYFAHARIASRFDPAPAFVLGAMLPDFAGMLGARIQRIDDEPLRHGEAHHHAQDRAFHRAPGFRELVVEGTGWLRRHGVSRGPARGAAHVGVELLLDGALLGDATADGAYLAALGDAPALDAAILWSPGDAARRWPLLRMRLRDAGLPHALRDPGRAARRVARALARRPLLRLAPRERDTVERWLREVQGDVVRLAPALLEQTLDRLAADGATAG